MVDFQSRDTRRGFGDEETDEDASEADDQSEEFSAGETLGESAETEYGPGALPFAVMTVTDNGSIESDTTGAAAVDAIEADGDAVATRELISPSYDGVQSTINALTRRDDVDAIVTLGGTGVSPEDVTVDAAEALFDKRLPGFGELYRLLSHDFDGTAVVRTRTTAGIVDGVPVFCLPDDTAGARRGVEQIVLEEAATIVEEATESNEAQ